MAETEQPTAHIKGGAAEIKKARVYKCSEPEIEWSCCAGVVCGHARRTGVNKDDMPVYRIAGLRHPVMAGTHVVVDTDGTLLAYDGKPVKRRCAMYGGL